MPSIESRHLTFINSLQEHIEVVKSLEPQFPKIERVANEMLKAIKCGQKVVWFGNGGSAADSQHMAAEFVGRFCRERKGLASIALTTDTSTLTAIANDYGFVEIFRRQVEAMVECGDVVVGISTSGNSENVRRGLELAHSMGAFTVAFTGRGGGSIAGIADVAIQIESDFTARIQEAHILCGHLLCDYVERCVCDEISQEAVEGAKQ